MNPSETPATCSSCYQVAEHVVTFSSPDPGVAGVRELVCTTHVAMYRVGTTFPGFPARGDYPATPEFTVVSVEHGVPVAALPVLKEEGHVLIDMPLQLAPAVPSAVEIKRMLDAACETARWTAARTEWYRQERQMDYETARRHAAQDWKARQKMAGVRLYWVVLAAELEVRLSGASPELAESLAEAGWDGVDRVLRDLLDEGRVVAAVHHVMRSTGLRLREARDWLNSYRRWSGAPKPHGLAAI